MVLTSFDESDCILDGKYSAAAALIIRNSSGGPSVVTCWKLSKEDLEDINRTGRCYLVVEGIDIPGCYISVQKPFEAKSNADNDFGPSDN